MRWVTVGTTDVHYLDVGSGQPVVLLHGLGSCAEVWFNQVDALSARWRVLAYDSVNHGHSSLSPEDEPEPDRADELEGFLTALGIDAPIVVGNSMGAITALRWATRHPRRALAIVVSAAGINPDETEASVRAHAEAMLLPAPPETVYVPGHGFSERYAAEHPVEHDRYRRLRSTATRLEAIKHPRRRTFTDPTIVELGGLVGTIASPMLIVAGEHDPSRTACEHLHSLVPRSQMAVIAGASHNAYAEAPAAFNSLVMTFLDEVTKGRVQR